MAESLLGPPSAENAGSSETFLREGAEEAGGALNALEEVAVRERRAVATLFEELTRSARDLQYERKWRGRDQLLNFSNLLATQAKAAEAGLGALLEQVMACQRLKGKQAELMEALSLLEVEAACYAHAVTATDSTFDPTTPYGAFVPALRLFTSELESVGKELVPLPIPEDFVEGSMRKKYQAALGRIAPLVKDLAPPPYAALYGRISAAREKLMQGMVIAKSRIDKDAAVLKGVQQLKADLASEFERVETLFAELGAAKTGEVRFPPSPALPADPEPTPAEPQKKGLFGLRARKRGAGRQR